RIRAYGSGPKHASAYVPARKPERGGRRPPRRCLAWCVLREAWRALPAPAGVAAAGADRGARAGDRGVGLRDRVDHSRRAGRSRRQSEARRRTGGGDVSSDAVRILRKRGLDADKRGDVGRIRAVVREVRLVRRLHVAEIALRRSVVRLVLLVQERRNRDRGEDAYDQNHDEKLDEREASLVVQTSADGVQQHCSSWNRWTVRSPPDPWTGPLGLSALAH